MTQTSDQLLQWARAELPSLQARVRATNALMDQAREHHRPICAIDRGTEQHEALFCPCREGT